MSKLCKYFSKGVISEQPATKFAKGKFFSLLLAVCTTFTACNDEETLLNQSSQLKLSFGINAPESRAIFTASALPDNSPVGVKLDGYPEYTSLVYTGTTTSGKQTWTADKSVTLTDTKGTLYAYWPQSSTVSIDAIPVDMTAADQTDWLYATPVTDICEDKAEAAVTMNHAAANINVTINKGTYLGTGAISNITVQSDGIALGGTFNAAQATPDYTAFEDEGEPLSRDLTTTTGVTTDIMVVPTGTSAAITFLATIDGIQFTAKSVAVQLAMGNSYQYTLNLSDISTYMEISGFSVKPWNSTTGGSLDLEQKIEPTIKVYAMSATNELIDYTTADLSAKGVVLHATGRNFDKKFMIAKHNAQHDDSNDINKEYLYFSETGNNLSLTNYSNVDGTNIDRYLQQPNGTFYATPYLSGDFTTWIDGALSDFNGKGNTAVIAASSSRFNDMCKVLEVFNAGINFHSNEDFKDWYIPALGQLALIYLNLTEINKALDKIGGTRFYTSLTYWSSSEKDANLAWFISTDNGGVMGNGTKKLHKKKVHFIRDL